MGWLSVQTPSHRSTLSFMLELHKTWKINVVSYFFYKKNRWSYNSRPLVKYITWTMWIWSKLENICWAVAIHVQGGLYKWPWNSLVEVSENSFLVVVMCKHHGGLIRFECIMQSNIHVKCPNVYCNLKKKVRICVWDFFEWQRLAVEAESLDPYKTMSNLGHAWIIRSRIKQRMQLLNRCPNLYPTSRTRCFLSQLYNCTTTPIYQITK